MSGYIIEEPNECPIYMDIEKNVHTELYWGLYSKHQRGRYKRVMRQLNLIWYNVLKTLTMMREYGMQLEECNKLMNKVHRMFFIEHRSQIEYYKEEKRIMRENKNYIKKKLDRMRNIKYKI